MNVEKQINKLKERVKELEQEVFDCEESTIDISDPDFRESPVVNLGDYNFEEFTTWADDEEPERESAVDIVHRLLGK